MLSKTEIDECFNQPSKSGFGKSRYDIAKEIIAAYEAKLREQEPVGYVDYGDRVEWYKKPTPDKINPPTAIHQSPTTPPTVKRH